MANEDPPPARGAWDGAVMPSSTWMKATSAYPDEWLDAYEDHVSLPACFRRKGTPPLDIAYLTALHVCQISTVPYENLQLHYSASHTVSLDPRHLFRKIVTNKRGRGGYCMENSILFNHVLRGLGFAVYTAGVRIRARAGGVPAGDYIGWVHMVNIVTLADGSQWHCDVGFGGDGATKPLPMVSGHVVNNLGTQEVRLLHGTIPATQQLDQSKKLWIYQYRNAPEQEWNAFYAFPETEFTAADFEVMNFYTSQSFAPTNLQTRTVLCIRFLSEPSGSGRVVVGKIMMVDGEVKRNDGRGRTTVLKVCKTEEERLATLRELFGITLTTEEREGVKGRNVELLG